MDKQRLDEFKALVDAITQGVWVVTETDPYGGTISVDAGWPARDRNSFKVKAILHHETNIDSEDRANAKFVAAAPMMVRELIAEVERYAAHVDMSKEGRTCVICGKKTRVGRVNRKDFWACLDCDYDDGFPPEYAE